MRYLFLGGLLACLVCAAVAVADPSPCNDRAAKSSSHVLARPVADRQGGETIADAVRIASIPFTDTGATCDNLNDYDEVCPYADSVAPDVVYVYTPSQNVSVAVDLGGSAYDTKVYVYDESLALIACNDDYYADYTSLIDYLPLHGGSTYFIVIDGYGEDCGEYVLDVRVHEPCEVICPAGAMIEGEPPLTDGYVDEFNGGCCGSDTGDWFQVVPGRSNGLQVLCARSGWYESTGMSVRDTDWFTITLGATGMVEVRGDAEVMTYLMELGPMDCASVGVLQVVEIGPCVEGTLTIAGEPFSDVWVWTGPTTFHPPGGLGDSTFDYVLWFDGLAPAEITGVPLEPAVVPSSLSTVKSLFE